MNYPKVWSKNQLQEATDQPGHSSSDFMRPIESLSAKQMDKLSKKPKVAKQPKLLSSKSLSQLVPRGLFFKKSRRTGQNKVDCNENVNAPHCSNRLVTTKSFPINSTYRRSPSSLESSRQEQFISRVNSVSMIGLPRQSSINSSFTGRRGSNNCTMEQPNLSPIVIGQSQPEHVDEPLEMSWCEIGPNVGEQTGQEKKIDENKNDDQAACQVETKRKVDGETTTKATGKYKPFKGTLVLRDVKNSLGLRMKAMHGSQAFSRLTNELATPPTKLYSPFNIYTPDSCTEDSCSSVRGKSSNLKQLAAHDNDCKTPNNKGEQQQDTATVKGRIAFRHKKHLLQANKFTFDSPTGKLRETVKDVEHFQQCIEDISKAIRARDSK